MYEKILVGTDGSDGAKRAVDTALDMAEQFDAELHALYVIDTTRYGKPALSSTELATEEVESFGSQQVEAVPCRGADRGIEVITRTGKGKVWTEISEYGDGHDVELIVLGSRGRGGVSPPRLGRVTTRVVQGATQPTIAV